MFELENNRTLILPWETFWMVGVGIKRFVKRLKLSVVEGEVSRQLNIRVLRIAIGNRSCELF